MWDPVSPDKDHNLEAYEGWAYSARTPDKEIFLLYFEKGRPLRAKFAAPSCGASTGRTGLIRVTELGNQWGKGISPVERDWT